jgi:Domain of unknown function (DUF6249)
MEILALLIPILGVIFAVGFPLSIPIIYLVLGYRRRKRMIELHHAERMAAIERGMEIPPLMLEPERQPRSGLQRGLVCSFVGAALIGSWLLMREDGLGVAGFVVGSIGIAYLVYYAIEGRKLALQPPPQEETRDRLL